MRPQPRPRQGSRCEARLERDIHDGLTRARASVSASIDGLRDLARGIYPPVLTARGLTAAIRAQVRDLDADVEVHSSAALAEQRPGPAAEVAAYFCCIEALQNAAKHAPGARVSVRLDRTTETLTFEVEDDGPGFRRPPRRPPTAPVSSGWPTGRAPLTAHCSSPARSGEEPWYAVGYPRSETETR